MTHRRPAARTAPPEKTCESCGRRIDWRAKLKDSWDEVRYCSTACRRHGVSVTDREMEERILGLLSTRAASATVCPSEVARAMAPATDADPDAWRPLMEPARRAARRLVARGEVVITQGGTVVDPSTAKGPIRIRRARADRPAPGPNPPG